MVLCAAFLNGASSLDWPIPVLRLESTFGSPAQGYILSGIQVSSRQAEVIAGAQGTIRFIQNSTAKNTALPRALGSMVVLSHDNGMEMVISGLDRLAPLDPTSRISSGQTLGSLAVSSTSPNPQSFIAIFDTKTGHWVNPLLVLPGIPGDVTIPEPTVYLTDSQSMQRLGTAEAVSQGLYTIKLSLDERELDKSGQLRTMVRAPYGIQVLIDGKDIANRSFDMLWWKDGARRLFEPGLSTIQDTYDVSGMLKIADVFLTRGKTTIGVIISTAYGKIRKSEWTVQVR
jgi:hypothetical protein